MLSSACKYVSHKSDVYCNVVMNLDEVNACVLFYPWEETKNFCSALVTHFVVGNNER